MSNFDYAGDLNPQETWDLLKANADSFLVDCRTAAEWQYVGVPDLDSIDRKIVFVEWQSFPMMEKNASFLSEISQTEIKKESSIVLLCRSGARSRSAAEFLTSYGYKSCYNCSDGFEGNHNDNGQRGELNGWKFSNLPWKQS